MSSSVSKKRSIIWKYFNIVSKGKAQCSYCMKTLSYFGGATGNLLRHMKSRHNVVSSCETLTYTPLERHRVFEQESDPTTPTEHEENRNTEHQQPLQRNSSNGMIKSPIKIIAKYPEEQIQPIYLNNKIHQLQNTVNKLERIVTSFIENEKTANKEDEFDLFCRSLAIQLKKLPELDALDLMQQIQQTVVNKRQQMKQLNAKPVSEDVSRKELKTSTLESPASSQPPSPSYMPTSPINILIVPKSSNKIDKDPLYNDCSIQYNSKHGNYSDGDHIPQEVVEEVLIECPKKRIKD